MRKFYILALLIFSIIKINTVFAIDAFADAPPRQEFYKGVVIESDDSVLQIKLLNGVDENKNIQIIDERSFETGEKVVLGKIEGLNEYTIVDKYRLAPIFWIFLIFIISVLVFGKLKGLGSLFGLALSILVLLYFIVPRILNGANPIFISLTGAFFIAVFSLYLAHGFTKRTSIALLGTLITLAISAILASIFVTLSKLNGLGSDAALSLQFGGYENVNLRGLLLGGIIIGVLGILDDITTGQVAAVDEIHKANRKFTFGELYSSGISVGREHIASLVNTLVLAYAGASLPLFLLFYTDENLPLWITLNDEFIAEELIRTLVGSMALLLAVPISTLLAVYFLKKN